MKVHSCSSLQLFIKTKRTTTSCFRTTISLEIPPCDLYLLPKGCLYCLSHLLPLNIWNVLIRSRDGFYTGRQHFILQQNEPHRVFKEFLFGPLYASNLVDVIMVPSCKRYSFRPVYRAYRTAEVTPTILFCLMFSTNRMKR